MESVINLSIYIVPIISQFLILLFIRKNLVIFHNEKCPINRVIMLLLTIPSFIPIFNFIPLTIILICLILNISTDEWVLRKEVKDKWWFN